MLYFSEEIFGSEWILWTLNLLDVTLKFRIIVSW